MGIDINAIRGRLNKLQNTKRRSDLQWKPEPGKVQVRIVPYKFTPENPFIELLFHYNIQNKTYLSPASFGRPDPIVEFAEKLKRMGDKEDWKHAKSMEPKLRTYVPVIVRGKENEGVKFWGFGKTVYQDLLGYIADPDYGDITDPKTGRDITVEYTDAKTAGTNYPVTTIRVKPNQTPLASDEETVNKLLEDQVEITELYSELSYDELKNILEGWLNPGDEEKKDSDDGQAVETKPTNPKPEQKQTVPEEKKENPTPSNNSEVEDAFDKLFNE